MYAIVKTGGKQYKVAPGDKINIEKLPAEVGDKVALDAICIVDGKKVEADPAKAAGTKVEAVVLEQFKGEKQLVFKFKKRKNYKKLRGHRQQLTRVQIVSVGSEKYAEPKKASKPKASKTTDEEPKAKAVKAEKKETAEKKPAAKSTPKAEKTTAAKTTKTATKASSASKAKTTTKKAAEKAEEKASEE